MTPERRPDFIIVGAPKSGTTAMYHYLRHHPDLFLPARKELRYFGRDLDIRDRKELSFDEYLEHFQPAPAASTVGAAYVWYLYSRSAAQEIHAFNPQVRIIAMLRNPVTMLPALHSEHLSNGNEDIADFTEALEAEPARRRGERIPAHAHLPEGLYYSAVPRYASQLRRYFSHFGRERVHVVIFDDFVAFPEAAYSGTVRFLGVRDDFRPPAFDVVNASKRLRSERLRHFLARPPAFPRLLIRRVVPARIRRDWHERAKRWNIITAPRAPVPAPTIDRLRELFVDEVRDLSDLLERDLSHWVAPLRPSGPPSGAPLTPDD